jgi:hypothetical protein
MTILPPLPEYPEKRLDILATLTDENLFFIVLSFFMKTCHIPYYHLLSFNKIYILKDVITINIYILKEIIKRKK